MVRMVTRPRLPLMALMLAAVMAGSGSLAGPVSAAALEFDTMPWIGLAAQLVGPITPSAISKGTDGRLTVLLVGSDWRPSLAGTGERTDAMMVMTINNSRQISIVSVPRDVGNFPIAPGTIFKPKVNGLFKYFKQTSNGDRNAALEKMRKAFAYGLRIQIDYVAYIRFTGLERLVKEVAGVPTTVAYNIYDSKINDERTSQPVGAKFMQSASTLMRGSDAPQCYTMAKPINWDTVPNCTRALLYVRSRHGPGNNDWRRARRQQGFVFAAIRRVIARGSGTNLQSLRSEALSNTTDFYTTLPTDWGSVLALYNMLNSATMPNQAVFKPRKYAVNVPGTSKQQLKLDAVRALTKAWFGPLN